MAHDTVKEQMLLLEENVSTDVWGIKPGTKSKRLFENELRYNRVILMRHRDGNGLIRVAHRACAEVFFESPGGRLRLQMLAKEYPGGFVKHYDPAKRARWSMTETRGIKRRGNKVIVETPRQTIWRGNFEEMRDPDDKGFRVRLDDDQIEQTSPNETYEEHDSKTYPGIRTGNFDARFRIFYRPDQFRILYKASDHGMKVIHGWVKD